MSLRNHLRGEISRAKGYATSIVAILDETDAMLAAPGTPDEAIHDQLVRLRVVTSMLQPKVQAMATQCEQLLDLGENE